MFVVSLLIVVLLFLIFIQDILSRSVHWVIFPFMSIFFVAVHLLKGETVTGYLKVVFINLAFLLIQSLLLLMYVSIKNRRLVALTDRLIGWGDILFILSLTLYFSFLNFLLFYITSLIAVIAAWLIWQSFKDKPNKQIPLAGLQAMYLLIVFTYCWLFYPGALMSDTWLFKYITL